MAIDRVLGFIILEPSPGFKQTGLACSQDHTLLPVLPFREQKKNAADLDFLEVHPEAPQADYNKLWPHPSPQT